MCYFRLDNIHKRAGTVRGAVGRARWTIPGNLGPSAAPPAGPRGPTLRIQYGAGSAAPEKTTIVLDSPHDRHISHARDGAGSKVSPHRLTSLLPSHEVRQTGSSAIYVSMHYISRTWSWAKATIWIPSPPMGLTIHIGAQLHGELRGVCQPFLSTYRTEVVVRYEYISPS